MESNQSPSALSKIHEKTTMPFYTALNYLLKNKKVRRLSWEDPEVHLAMGIEQKIASDNNILMIFKTEDSEYHPLILCELDIVADDWVLYD